MSSKKFDCDCGSKNVSYYTRKNHYKTKRHQNFINNNIKWLDDKDLIESIKPPLTTKGRPKSENDTNYNKERYTLNKEKLIESSTKYRIENTDKYNSYHKCYYSKNADYRQRKILKMREYMKKKRFNLKNNLNK